MSTKKYSPTLDAIQSFLEKARRRMNDEDADIYESSDYDNSPEEDLQDLDADELEGGGSVKDDDAEELDTPAEDSYDPDRPWYEQEAIDRKREKAIKEKAKKGKADKKVEKPKEEVVAQEKAPVKAAAPVGPMIRRKAATPSAPEPAAPSTPTPSAEPNPATQPAAATPAAPKRVVMPTGPKVQTYAPSDEDDALQPSREELLEMREYTRPWEQRARDRSRLEAQPELNPHKHHQGRLIEARNLSHADRQKAYAEFQATPEYQSASKVGKMKLDAQFAKDWLSKNPDHVKNAITAHSEASKHRSTAKELFERRKDEQIRHIGGGGVQSGAYSVEEGMQHVGGDRGEDGESAPSGISQDAAASFAGGNREFVQQYMDEYNKKGKKFGGEGPDLEAFKTSARADIDKVLGDHPALKDPAKKAKMNSFFERFYPQIEKAKWRVAKKLGLEQKLRGGEIDEGLLNMAGMRALYQAVNDYDHDHPSQAKFTTHLNRKMHGLMQTALGEVHNQEVPSEVRAKAKQFNQQQKMENMSPVRHVDKFGNVNVIGGPKPKPPEVAPAPTIAPAKASPPVVRRPSHEIAANHHPDVQDRLKRVAAAKQPLMRRNVRNVNLEEEE